MLRNVILQGDALAALRTLPDGCVDMCLTSPPYWALRDYGTATWEGGSADCDHFQCRLSSSKSTLHPTPEKKKMETGIPFKNVCGKCGAKRVDFQLGLEPTPEEYIRKLCDVFDEVKRVLKPQGSCWVNLGDCYGGPVGEPNAPKLSKGRNDGYKAAARVKKHLPAKALVQIPNRFSIEMGNRGWLLRNELIWHKGNCIPSSAKDRFTIDYERLFFFTKSTKYYFKQQVEPSTAGNPVGRNARSVWTINATPFRDAHFATYPEGLCEKPIDAGCPEGGIVLDPFFGAGTSGLVALKQGKDFVGIELNPQYVEIAEKRLTSEMPAVFVE